MKEIRDILIRYEAASKAGKKSALATVVKVEGSSYRRAGARMLVTEDGQLTGAISGGCLEGDALRKALTAILQQENKLITYDTTDEDDAKFGIQLGCNGIVHILFEPVSPEMELNPIKLLELLQQKRENAVLVTLFSHSNKNQLGTTLLYRKDETYAKSASGFDKLIQGDIVAAFENEMSAFKPYENETEAFIEFIPPPLSLIVAGAGNDAQPLVNIASILGWEITVVDGRPTHANSLRFPNAHRIIMQKAENVLPHLSIDNRTACVLMTHNYNYDSTLLNDLLKTNIRYIGALGPKKKLNKMLDELNKGTSEAFKNLYGPVGLDIGAETAEEIAVSIAAEIKMVFTGGTAQSLRKKKQPIHLHVVE
ncbi:XdhC family protein [Pedobacter endophyticus]|uniref:XdhC family protein n=1 Tax=Pedobacter endophyticus TaxID=2789740 RepID=A0A7S9L1D6_9SPHI|nr:XdhC/CoxI family protein [Pedobacter endophyticus]QPH40694.1 XdhC family protein [Pedobacter endophyticus]